MAKDCEVSLPALDELVQDYAREAIAQTTGPWKDCQSMHKALIAGDVDTGLAFMRQVCPAALEDVRLLFRAKKQKFAELIRSGSGPEAALACARSELAPLALGAYPEAYGEFKHLLLLLLTPAGPQPDSTQPPSGGPGQSAASGATTSSPGCSSAEFADMAFFTVRSMLGLQQPLLGLLLRFLLRLHSSHPASASTPGGVAAAGLAPQLLLGAGSAREPAPLPVAPGSGPFGSGSVVQSFPEGQVQAVIQGAGTTRSAAMEALRRTGGDALAAFKAELGRLRVDERLLAELVLEYGRFRGLLAEPQAQALAERAAGGGEEGRDPSAAQSGPGSGEGNSRRGTQGGGEAAGPADAAAGSSGRGDVPAAPQDPAHGSVAASGSGRGPGGAAGPLGQSRSGSAGNSPPCKVPRVAPPDGDDVMEAAAVAPRASGGESEPAEARSEGRGSGRMNAGAGSSPEGVEEGGGGSQAGTGPAGAGLMPPSDAPRGPEVLSTLVRLAQADDPGGVLALVSEADPGLWEQHPALLFDVHRCQYGKLLAAGQLTEALDLARKELTPLATAYPALLPALKSAMTALLPQTAPPAAALGGKGPGGSEPVGLLPALPAVAGAIQAALQQRLGLQPPRLVRLMEGLLVSYRIWKRSERMTSDPFATALKINALRVTGPTLGQPAIPAPGHGPTPSSAPLPPPPLPPPPRPPPGPPPPAPAAAAADGAGAPAAAAPWNLNRIVQEAMAAELQGGGQDLWYRIAGGEPGAGRLPFALVRDPVFGALRAEYGGLGEQGAPAVGAGGAGTAAGGGEEGEEEGAAGGGAEDEDDDDDGSGGGGMDVDEGAVLQLMEILELPRGAAIELLANHEGDVQAAVLSMMP